MSERETKEGLSIHGKGSSYRIAVPSDWARKESSSDISSEKKEADGDESHPETHENITRKQVGDYLIAFPEGANRPPSTAEIDTLLELYLDSADELKEAEEAINRTRDPGEDGEFDIATSFVGNIVQAYLIAGADTLVPKWNEHDIENEDVQALISAFKDLQAGPDELKGDTRSSGEHQLKLNPTLSDIDTELYYEQYVDEVSEFIYSQLITRLDPDATIFDTPNKQMDVHETEIDIKRALADNQSIDVFLRMDRSRYNKEIGRLYISSQLEHACDLSERAKVSIDALEQVDPKFDSLVEEVKKECFKLLKGDLNEEIPGEEIPAPIYERLEDLASFKIDEEDTDGEDNHQEMIEQYTQEYFREIIYYFRTVHYLEELRSDEFEFLFTDALEEYDPESDTTELLRASMQIGQIFAYIERLIRIPRSIAKAKLGTVMLAKAQESGTLSS